MSDVTALLDRTQMTCSDVARWLHAAVLAARAATVANAGKRLHERLQRLRRRHNQYSSVSGKLRGNARTDERCEWCVAGQSIIRWHSIGCVQRDRFDVRRRRRGRRADYQGLGSSFHDTDCVIIIYRCRRCRYTHLVVADFTLLMCRSFDHRRFRYKKNGYGIGYGYSISTYNQQR